MFRQRSLTLSVLLSLIFILLFAACGGSGSNGQEVAVEPAVEESVSEAPADTAEVASAAEAPADGIQTFVIIPAESRATYLVDEEFLENMLSKYGIEAGKSITVGSTQAVSGEIQLNLEDLTAALGNNSFSVDLSTLKSDQDRRDNWIRNNGPTFNNFPMATFTATSLSGLPASYTEGDEIQFQINGDLTVHGVTVPVTFDASATLEGDSLSGLLSTRGLMSNFGIEPPSFAKTLTVTDEFGIEVEFTAKRQ